MAHKKPSKTKGRLTDGPRAGAFGHAVGTSTHRFSQRPQNPQEARRQRVAESVLAGMGVKVGTGAAECGCRRTAPQLHHSDCPTRLEEPTDPD